MGVRSRRFVPAGFAHGSSVSTPSNGVGTTVDQIRKIRSGPGRMFPHFLHDLGHALRRASNRSELTVEQTQVLADETALLDRNPRTNGEVDSAQLAHPAHQLSLEHSEIQGDGLEGE